MINLLPAPAERRLLGGPRLSGPTPWVIAIMSFSMMVVAAAGLAIASMAGVVADSAQQRYSVQVPDGRQLDRVLATVRAAPGVASADPVSEARMRTMLERWLGPAADSRDLPVPALVHFDLRPGSDLRAVAERVSAIAPSARTVAHRETLGPLLRSLRAMQGLALGLVALLAAATSAAVVLAARGALDTHRFTIEVMHGIGATDRQITRLFERKIAIDSLVGSLVGAVAASLVLTALAVAGGRFVGELSGGVALGPFQLILLALLPFALAALATMVGRAAVLATLRQAL